jgi:biofilm PGA synthesis N-glycosyltransferase PgaC
MGNQYLSASIGIPVYNEEINIQKLLNTLSKQHGINIEKTIVVNDGSTDGTLEKIYRVSENIKTKINLELINLETNKGKANALNLIFRRAQSDYLILLDSDVYFSRNDTLRSLLEYFKADSNVGLVCGWYRIENLNSFNIIGRAYKFSSNLLKKIACASNNIYGATGAIMALHKEVYKNLTLPKSIVGVDTYIYLYTLSVRKKFVFAPDVEVIMPLYKRETLKVFLYRQLRLKSIPEQHLKIFGYLAKQELKGPDLKILLKAFITSFARYPIDGTIWVILKINSFIYRKSHKHVYISHLWRRVEK